MAFRLSTDTRNKACDAIVDDIDAGGSAGTCDIRTGTQPTNVGDADTGIYSAQQPSGHPDQVGLSVQHLQEPQPRRPSPATPTLKLLVPLVTFASKTVLGISWPMAHAANCSGT